MRRPMVFTLLAALAATFAALIVYSALEKREAELRKVVANSIDIAVAARELPLGTRIEPGTVRMVRWSRDSLPPGAVTDPQTVMNKVVKAAFIENEPIVTGKLFAGDKPAGVLPLLIPPGMRAMSVAVDEVSDVAGFILPQARVDVLVSISESGGEKTFSKVVLQNVQVLAVAQQIEGKKDEPQVVKVVTLLVRPDEAERLALAGHQGSLRLALRNYTDEKIVLTSGSDVASLLRAYGTGSPSVPLTEAQSSPVRAHGARSPLGQTEVEILRDGSRRELISFVKGSWAKQARESETASTGSTESASPVPGDSHAAQTETQPVEEAHPIHAASAALGEARPAALADSKGVDVP
jgi:pilus assembly protein CpaB